MKRDINRVVFYSIQDLSKDRNLQNAESLIEKFDSKNLYDINDILELYQIKLYFDNELYRSVWSEETKENYLKTVNSFWETITSFFLKINSENISTHFNSTDYQYYDSFWTLISQLSIHKKISSDSLKEILKNNRFHIRQLLKQKNIVNHFSRIISDFLMDSTESAELLLSQFEEDHILSEKPKLFFPAKLKDSDKESMILNYLDLPNANLNYVKLVVNSRTLKLSDKIKLKAKRLEKKQNDDFFKREAGTSQRVQGSLSKDQDEPFKLENKNGQLTHSYSEKWLNATKSNENIFRNFSYLFRYINEQGCIELVSKNHEIESLERVFMRSKNEYLISFKFHGKSLLSHIQLALYLHYLQENKINLENVLSHQVNEVLNERFEIKGLTISFASENASPLEKIRFIAPELEFLIKQYQCYVEEGFIDFDLIKISSSQLHLSKVKSKLNKKYVYGQGEEYLRLNYYFFSNSSMLYYIEPFKEKYRSFYQLLTNENIGYEDFQDYQKGDIDYLISNNYLYKDKDGFLRIKNQELVFVIGKLHYEDVLNFWHYSEQIRNEILEMEKKGMVKFENTLFTIEERKYLNYYLNKKEFSNGMDLRNKYLHGTNSSSEDEQQNDYQILLKLIILIIYKIKDDLNLYETEQKTGANTV
ncbi:MULTISPECIES: hypothetical protein [Bizionia]|uniref:Uncharacterized protein n=1 Tax=Bizionia algoritergicola TaxID=291187 RepID=A0A5D0QLL7_9FLAO|nr:MULTISPECIES: hypothetical protein [Bizionia]OBX18062.1 hypothetical protein BAA08_15620 [Bizionia sp. APA-3]TYB70013.1 hypothetical protein ES675_16010 [Bizionia algoritergicola]